MHRQPERALVRPIASHACGPSRVHGRLGAQIPSGHRRDAPDVTRPRATEATSAVASPARGCSSSYSHSRPLVPPARSRPILRSSCFDSRAAFVRQATSELVTLRGCQCPSDVGTCAVSHPSPWAAASCAAGRVALGDHWWLALCVDPARGYVSSQLARIRIRRGQPLLACASTVPVFARCDQCTARCGKYDRMGVRRT